MDPTTRARHRAQVLALANHKGGCGKTTSAANLGVALAARRRRVLLIDVDPQANLGEAFGVDADHPGPRIEHALLDPTVAPWHSRRDPDDGPTSLAAGVHLLPCSDRLEAVVSQHVGDPRFPYRLRELVDALRPHYDAIVLDTPPGLGPLSSMAMLTADWVIVPARPADFDVGGAIKLAHLIAGALRDVNPTLRLLGVLITQVDRRWTLAADTRAALEANGIRRLRVEIPFRVRVSRAPRHAAPTAALEPDSPVGAAYHRLAADLLATVLSDTPSHG